MNDRKGKKFGINVKSSFLWLPFGMKAQLEELQRYYVQDLTLI